MGKLVTLALAAIVGVAIAAVTSISVAHAVSPDRAIAKYLENHPATQPDVLDYGSR